MTTGNTPDWLETAAARSAEDPASLGSLLEAYRQKHQLSREQLADKLGCSNEKLLNLYLCGRPTDEQISAIATRFELARERLSSVLQPPTTT